jgi:hypothetical protein
MGLVLQFVEVGDTLIYDLPGLYIKASEACTSGRVSIKSSECAGRQSHGHCVVVVERVCTAEKERTVNAIAKINNQSTYFYTRTHVC